MFVSDFRKNVPALLFGGAVRQPRTDLCNILVSQVSFHVVSCRQIFRLIKIDQTTIGSINRRCFPRARLPTHPATLLSIGDSVRVRRAHVPEGARCAVTAATVEESEAEPRFPGLGRSRVRVLVGYLSSYQ